MSFLKRLVFLRLQFHLSQLSEELAAYLSVCALTVFILPDIIERISCLRQDLVYFALVIESLGGKLLFGISFELRVELELLFWLCEGKLGELPRCTASADIEEHRPLIELDVVAFY